MEVKQVEGGDGEGEAEWRLRLTDGNFEICNGKTVAATFGWLTTERDYTIWPLTPSWRDAAPRLDNENGLTVIAVIPWQPWQCQLSGSCNVASLALLHQLQMQMNSV